MKKYIFLLLLASYQPSFADDTSHEQILGYIPSINEIYLRVYSGGCTEKKDFVFQVQESENLKLITLYRLRPDYCLSFFPTGKTLIFSHQELGLKSGDHFRITNKLQDGVVW